MELPAEDPTTFGGWQVISSLAAARDVTSEGNFLRDHEFYGTLLRPR